MIFIRDIREFAARQLRRLANHLEPKPSKPSKRIGFRVAKDEPIRPAIIDGTIYASRLSGVSINASESGVDGRCNGSAG